MQLTTVLAAAFIASVVDLSGLFLFWKRGWARRYSKPLVSFAAGALLGAAFLELLPESLELGASPYWAILGILIFYFLERIVFLHHTHPEFYDSHSRPVEEKRHPSAALPFLMIFGNSLHDFLDGVIIALSFLASPGLGLVATIAVVAHEFPSGIGEFSILIFGGVGERQALLYTILSILATPLGALVALLLAGVIDPFIAPLLALASGGFIYIAAVDLIPETHKEFDRRRSLVQGLFLVLGILVIFLAGNIISH